MRGTRFGIGRLPWTTSESSIRRTTGTGARFAWGHYECIGNDSGGSREAEQPALIVGQDGILRAGWATGARAGLFARGSGGLPTRRRLPTCPTTSAQFPFGGKLREHWPRVPAPPLIEWRPSPARLLPPPRSPPPARSARRRHQAAPARSPDTALPIPEPVRRKGPAARLGRPRSPDRKSVV